MQVDLYINGEKLDISENTVIAETKQVSDFIDIKDANTSYTNSFKVPKTERNKKLFGLFGVIGNTSISPFKLHNVAIYRNGVPTVQNGIGIIQEANYNSYSLHVYSDNISLFDVLGDKALSDLKLSSLNHDLNINTWIASHSKAEYCYAVADYGKTDNNVLEVDYQVPSLYVSFLWNKIFSESGFKWKYSGRGGKNDFNPFFSSEFDQLAITIDAGFEKAEGASGERLLKIYVNKTSNYDAKTIPTFFGQKVLVNSLPDNIIEYARLTTENDKLYMHQFSESQQYNRSRIRAQKDGFYRIEVKGSVFNHNTTRLALFVEKDEHNLFTINEDFTEAETAVGFSNKIYLRKGEEIFIKFEASKGEDNNYLFAYNLSLEVFEHNNIQSVNFSSYLTSIKQKDFIKDIIHHFGLIFQKKGDTYHFISLEELLDPTAQYKDYNPFQRNEVSIDWSKKYSETVRELTTIGNYARRNNFEYQYVNEEDNYANGAINIPDETLEIEKTAIKRIFAAPDRSTANVNNTQLRLTNHYTKEYNDDGSLKEVKPNKTKPFFFKAISRSGKFNYKQGTQQFSYNGNYKLMSFDDLDFNNIIPNRYAAFANMLTYARRYEVKLWLNPMDINQLDFFKLIYLKQLGALFYISKITNYKGGDVPTLVELIKIRASEKLGEFSDDFNEDFNI